MPEVNRKSLPNTRGSQITTRRFQHFSARYKKDGFDSQAVPLLSYQPEKLPSVYDPVPLQRYWLLDDLCPHPLGCWIVFVG